MWWEYYQHHPGLFFTGWGSSPALNFGKKIHSIYLQKGKKNLDVNIVLGENCMILKNCSLEKQPYSGPCYGRKNIPATTCC
jgi:hypothetical protein